MTPVMTNALSLCLGATMPDGHWTPGIGDPTVVGWVTVAAYFFAAWLCYRAARRAQRRARCGDATVRPRFCFSLTATMFALGVNKQLDLQTLLTDIGRTLAKSEGWYVDRRYVQVAFIASIATLGVCVLAAAAWMLRKELRRAGLMWGGMLFLVGFIVVRATSFHHIDRMLGCAIGDFITVNALLELSGIAMVGLGAARYVRGTDVSLIRTAAPTPIHTANQRRAEVIWNACQQLSTPTTPSPPQQSPSPVMPPTLRRASRRSRGPIS